MFKRSKKDVQHILMKIYCTPMCTAKNTLSPIEKSAFFNAFFK